MSNDTEVTYNLPLINALNEMREKAGISYETLAELIGCKKSITHKYLTKSRTLVRGDTERRATAVVRLLREMVDEKILPLPEEYFNTADVLEDDEELSRVTKITLGVIDDYLDK